MVGIQADWVDKTPEEWHEMTTGEKEYTVKITMTGEITLFAKDYNEAKEKVSEMCQIDLIEYIEDVDVD